MSERYDVVFIGSGINSLAGAALLARGGKRVLVLERADRLGGAIWTAEITEPGFVHEVMASWHPLFVGSAAYAELADELHALGLEYLNTELPTGWLGPDGEAAFLTTSHERNVEELERLAPGDGEAWSRDGAGLHAECRPLVRRPDDRALVAGRLRARAQGLPAARTARARRVHAATCSSRRATGSRTRSRRRGRTASSRPGCCTRASDRTRPSRGS